MASCLWLTEFKPHAEMLFSSFEQLVDHMPVLVQHLDTLVPTLNDPDLDIDKLMHHMGVLLPHTHGLLAHKTIVRMIPTIAALLPEAPRRQREMDMRRERRLAQLTMAELWRLMYKYSGEERAETCVDKIAELSTSQRGPASMIAQKNEAIRELIHLCRHRYAPIHIAAPACIE